MRYQVTVNDRVYTIGVSEGSPSVTVELDGHRHQLELLPDLGSTHFRVGVDGAWYPVAVRRDTEGMWIEIGEDRYRVRVERAFPIPTSRAVVAGHAQIIEVKAPMPGLIVAVEVITGAWVDQGRPVVIMEAMKMQMEIRAPASGRVVAVRVQSGQEVLSASVLMTLDRGASQER